MLPDVCLWIAGLALLCAVFGHVRKNRRIGGGVVLAAVMLSLQAVIQPASTRMMAVRFEEDGEQADEEEAEGPGEGQSLERQMLRHGRRLRTGETEESPTLRLPSRKNPEGR